MEKRQLTADCELAPTIITEYRRGWRGAAEQEQKGAYFNKEAVPQLIPTGLTADEHYEAALKLAQTG